MNKISILIPVYNGEQYIIRLLNSIIEQAYQNIELIVINDGSTDSTETIVNDFVKNHSLCDKTIYISKINEGQASAINVGLKYVTGDYFVWIDADDFLLKNSLLKRAEVLDTNSDIDFVMSNGYIFKYPNYDNPVSKAVTNDNKESHKFNNYFENLIVYEKITILNCGYMYRTNSFFKFNNGRSIFVSKEGQNLQMLLPMAYYGKGKYISDCLYGRVEHEDSHFHSINFNDYNTYVNRLNGVRDIYLNTISLIEKEELRPFAIYIQYKNLVSKYRLALRFKQKNNAKKYKNDINRLKKICFGQGVRCFKCNALFFLYSLIHKF